MNFSEPATWTRQRGAAGQAAGRGVKKTLQRLVALFGRHVARHCGTFAVLPGPC